jgi:hypothetical protein
MVTDRLAGTAQVADTDEIHISVMEEGLTATVREPFVFTPRVRLCYCTMLDVALAVDLIHGGARTRMYK